MQTKRYFVSRCQIIPSIALLVTAPKITSAIHTNPGRGQTFPFSTKYPVLPSHRSNGNNFASEKRLTMKYFNLAYMRRVSCGHSLFQMASDL